MADVQTINAGPVTVRISGLEAARQIMRDFPAKLEKKVLRAALNKAAAIGQKAAREEAKKRSDSKGTYTTIFNPTTGKIERIKYHKSVREKHLYESIGRRSKTLSASGMIRVSVGEISNMPHGWLVEYGHRMVVGGTVARISGKQAGKAPKAKRQGMTGKGRVVGQVEPHPWISIAFERSSAQMMSVFETEVVSRGEAEAAKMVSSAAAGGSAA
jgi:hypothetical protein